MVFINDHYIEITDNGRDVYRIRFVKNGQDEVYISKMNSPGDGEPLVPTFRATVDRMINGWTPETDPENWKLAGMASTKLQKFIQGVKLDLEKHT